MKVSISTQNLQDMLAEIKQKTGSDYHSDVGENILRFPSHLGKGYIHNLHLRDGIELYLHEYNLEENLVIKAETKPFLGLGYCITGHVGVNIVGSKADWNMKTGRSLLMHTSGCESIMEIPARQPIFLVEMSVNNTILNSLIENCSEPVDRDIKQAIAGKISGNYSFKSVITPSSEIVLNQIKNCPYQGLTKKLYLEGKAIELLAIMLSELTNNQSEDENYQRLKADEISRIYLAREILVANLDNPPSLMTLAQKVGLNDCKLKRGFRQVFGTTAFGYLHQERMERSRLLLESGLMNVSQVATAVGYTNFSHFTAAFKRKFGINPSALKLRS